MIRFYKLQKISQMTYLNFSIFVSISQNIEITGSVHLSTY